MLKLRKYQYYDNWLEKWNNKSKYKVKIKLSII